MIGIYVHIPFCHSRCIYCDFVSTTLNASWQKYYIDSLLNEIKQRAQEMGTTIARTVYIGGGTPSQLHPQELLRLCHALEQTFRFTSDIEFTLEANPDDISPAFIQTLKQTPINRISMGIQSTDDNMLRLLKRRHTASQALQACAMLQEAGYTNLSGDLIYALPHQCLDMFLQDLSTLLNTGIPHLSAYALQYEPNTPLYAMLARGEVPPEDEELALACYENLISHTQAAGMEQYEISNFACPGMQSRHNSAYWLGLPYLGLGAGAHSYDGVCKRIANTASVKQYIAGKRNPQIEILSLNERYDERIMLGLRTRQGIDLRRIEQDFGPTLRKHCEKSAQAHLHNGLIIKKGEHFLLAQKALFISDSIICDLMAPS